MNQSNAKQSIYEHPMQGMETLLKTHGIAALYCRLSSDDGRDGESKPTQLAYEESKGAWIRENKGVCRWS